MITEKQKLRIIKYKNRCLELGYDYIEHLRKNKRTYIKCKCNNCNIINDIFCGNLMNGEIRCNNCLIIKYQNRCKELGYEYIEHKKGYIKCRCDKCNIIKEDVRCDVLMKNNIRCNNCLVVKYKSKCLDFGYEYIEHFRKKTHTYIKCKCNNCDTIKEDVRCGSLIKGNVSCNNCLIVKYQNRCQELGYNYIEHLRKNK